MAEPKSPKPTPAGKPKAATGKDAADKRLVLMIARTLWGVYHEGDSPKLDTDQRRDDWRQHRAAYIQTARKLIRRLEKKGVTISPAK